MKRYTLLHLAVGVTLVGLGTTSLVYAAPLDSALRADSLLSVDQNRTEIVEGLVAKWKDHLASGKEADLKKTLMGLRADKLLAVSLAQDQKQFAALLEKDSFLPVKESMTAGVKGKAVGEPNVDVVYTPITPCRLFYTEIASGGAGGALLPGVTRTFNTRGSLADQGGAAGCSVPSSATAIVLQMGAFSSFGLGWINAGPQGSPIPSGVLMAYNNVAFINATSVTLKINPANGQFSAFSNNTQTELYGDVLGYFALPANGNGLRVVQSTDANFGTSPNTINGVLENRVSKTCPSGPSGLACQAAIDNQVIAGTIGGGGRSDQPNKVTDSFGTVGGGINNRAGNDDGDPDAEPYATVAGGGQNVAAGNASTVGGGFDNQALAGAATVSGGANNRALADGATVSGGRVNVASGERSVVAGGSNNTASGLLSIVSGGTSNFARGANTWAGGRRADANFDGSFVWADSNDFLFPSVNTNAFNVRSTGGARIVTAINASGTATAGVSLLAGDSSWNVISDRAAKDNWTPVNAKAILAKLAKLPLASWNYKAQDASVKHIGPSAQDFRAAFGLGHGDKTIATVDADGVALAAIQGLHQVMKEKDAKIVKLERELAAIKKKLGL